MKAKVKKEIVIVSDLWGRKGGEWFSLYEQLFAPQYNVSFCDVCELAEINLEDYTQEKIHQQFVEGGIDVAVNKLLKEMPSNKIYIGCSIGGVILWKAALQGFQMYKLITISSTRLRFETEKPDCLHKMIFGRQDKYLPTQDWIDSMGVGETLFVNGGHEIYKDKKMITELLSSLVE